MYFEWLRYYVQRLATAYLGQGQCLTLTPMVKIRFYVCVCARVLNICLTNPHIRTFHVKIAVEELLDGLNFNIM